MAAAEVRSTRASISTLVIGLALALVVTAGPAAAQQAYGPSAGQTSPGAAMKNLHDALHLSTQQEAAWRAYSAQVGSEAQARVRQQAGARMMPSLDAPHRMDLIEAEMRQELADLHGRAQALKALYAQLTPAQRKTFDRQTLPPQRDR